MNETKLQKVLNNMCSSGLKQLLICSPMSIFYLTGRMISPGERLLALIVRENGDTVFVVNKLFAQAPLDGAEMVAYSDTDDNAQVLSGILLPGKLGVDKDFRCRFLLPLMELRPDIKPVNGSGCVDNARMIKTAEELNVMREASLKNDVALLHAYSAIKEGATEAEVADAYRTGIKAAGGAGESFDSLVCFGPNCAEPHHNTDDTLISVGDSVILDVGLKYGDYCSDMTRTVFFGKPADEQKRVYDLVCKANNAGRAAVRPGVPLRDVDAAARRVIEEAGYGEYFIHRTGHGIGLEVHEFPDVSSASDIVCTPGMVFSVEPGVYLPGRFGVRVEDLVAVTQDGCETLNRLSKDLTVL